MLRITGKLSEEPPSADSLIEARLLAEEEAPRGYRKAFTPVSTTMAMVGMVQPWMVAWSVRVDSKPV